jgi:radical SAM superfamily enzyme YgiQ (UPF0313 family)
MKILFVNPRFQNSLWRLTGITDIVPQRCAQTPLGLLTVAALTPPEFEVELQDENVAAIDVNTDADVVAIGCWNIQYNRARELAEAFRSRGKTIVVGGPYPSLCPERFMDGIFDVVFDGEVEITWPQFCADLVSGSPKPLYKQEGNIDISLSPVPRLDLASKDDYLYYFLQTTRGCPFKCEFCDIIITDGRVPRVKAVSQVLAEVEKVAAIGGKHISFSDANLIGNMRYAEELLKALEEYGRANDFPINFSGEMTINVAEKPRLLELMHDANFTSIFLGIESPRIASLTETQKRQNTHKPLMDSIRKIQSHNIAILAGMIVGFDNDDSDIFQEQFEFLQEAGIPFTTSGVLTAIEKTPLYGRLEKEGRLIPYDSAQMQGHGSADLNFIPKLMTIEEVQQGYNWLIRSLYKYESYGARLATGLSQFRPDYHRGGGTSLDWEKLGILASTIRHYVLTTDRARRRFFLKTLWQAMWPNPTSEKLDYAITYMISQKHFHEYVKTTHGDPETVPESPFAERTKAEHAWGDLNEEYVKKILKETYPRAGRLVRMRRRLRHSVAIPEAFLKDNVGQRLSDFLSDLDIDVVPVASAALSRMHDKVDVLVLPILNKVLKGREELQQVVQYINEELQREFKRFPEVVHFPMDQGDRAALEAFTRIGLLYTSRVERLQRAYVKAFQ